jgi:hypothetical protein
MLILVVVVSLPIDHRSMAGDEVLRRCVQVNNEAMLHGVIEQG